MKLLALKFLLLCYLLGPEFRIGPLVFNTSLLVPFFSLMGVFYFIRFGFYRRKVVVFLAFWASSVVSVILAFALVYSEAILWLNDFGYFVLSLFSAIFFFCMYKTVFRQAAMSALINDCGKIVLINSLVILLSLYSSAFLDIFYSFVNLSPLQKAYAFRDDSFIRLSGLSYSGFGGLALLHSAVMLLVVNHFIYNREQPGLYIAVFVFLTVIANFYVATIGNVLFFLSLTVLAVFYFMIHRPTVWVSLLILLSVLFALFYMDSLLVSLGVYTKEGNLHESLRLVLNESFGDGFSANELFFGIGDFGSGRFDNGYLVAVSAFGLFSLVLLSFPFVFVFFKGLISRVSGLYSYFACLSLFYLLALYKNVIFFGVHDFLTFYLLVFVFSVFSHRVVKFA